MAQHFKTGLRHFAFDLHQIGLGQLELWIGDPCLQPAIVRQQHQPFAVHIEAACRIDAGHIYEMRQCLAGRAGRAAIGELREHPEWLVEQDQPRHASPPLGSNLTR